MAQALSQAAAPLSASSISVSKAHAILEKCRETAELSTKTRASALQSIADLKATVECTERTLEEAANRTSSFTSDLDAKFAEFKGKFDSLNKLMTERMSVMLGGAACSGQQRPAEYITDGRVAQVLHRAKKVVVLTGAGISAESGIPTFRGADGFWTIGSENYRPQELATWEKFNEMPEELWRWYQYRWGICTKAKPNSGHMALVELEGLVEGGIDLVTQNIDGLHRQAGSNPERLSEIHGRIDEMRCDERVEGSCLHGLKLDDPDNFDRVRATIVKTPQPAAEEENERLPMCKKCGVRQRPKILWFDESYNEAFYKWSTIQHQMKSCDVLLIIGTMLTTGGPARMVEMARKAGSIIIRIDTQVDLADSSSQGMLHVRGKSGEVLPRILAELRALRTEPRPAPLNPDSLLLVSQPVCKSAPGISSAKKQESKSTVVSRSPPSTPVKALNSRGTVAKRTSSTPATRRSATGGANNSTLMAAASISLTKGKTRGAQTSANPPVVSVMAHNTQTKNGAPFGFFVYGTLRPDDDSGASWTQKFCEGMDAEAAFLDGASLYIDGAYPAVCLEQTKCCVRGMLLTPSTIGNSSTHLASKLKEADKIEGYPDLYERAVATIRTVSGEVRRAYVYHRTGRTDRSACTCILDGDWMSRKRA
jgi:NAD-dependent deacetylase